MRDTGLQIELGRQLIEKTPDLDLEYAEMKQIMETYRELRERHGEFDSLFRLVGDVYMMGLGIGYRFGFGDGTERLSRD